MKRLTRSDGDYIRIERDFVALQMIISTHRDIALRVWENTPGDIEAAEAPFSHIDTGLLRAIFRELCASAFHEEGVYDCSQYTKCFKIEDWNLRGARWRFLWRILISARVDVYQKRDGIGCGE